MRLAKYLAHAGASSRRGAERLIADGRVQIDGETVLDPARDVNDALSVSLDGRILLGPEPRVAHILNKPLGVVSTARDTHGRPTVVELIADSSLRLYPVGRLDVDSSGLILLTNDGELANRLMHPRFEVAKTYRVLLGGGPVANSELRQLREGVLLDDGLTAPARVARRKAPPASSARGDRRPGGRSAAQASDHLELTIHEGRNRQVRRMCEAIGHPVLELQRIAFGPLRLDGLAVGQHRRLSEHELRGLRQSLT